MIEVPKPKANMVQSKDISREDLYDSVSDPFDQPSTEAGPFGWASCFDQKSICQDGVSKDGSNRGSNWKLKRNRFQRIVVFVIKAN